MTGSIYTYVVNTTINPVPVSAPSTDAKLDALNTNVSALTKSTDNQSVNVMLLNSTPVDVSTGNASGGTLRVVLASNQPTLPVSISSMPSTSWSRQSCFLAGMQLQMQANIPGGFFPMEIPAIGGW